MPKNKKGMVVITLALLLGGCGFMPQTLYCLRVGDNYPGHFICTDKDEEMMDELDFNFLPGEKIPENLGRIKITFRPFYPINGKSVWPLWGYSFEDYSGKYNDGTPIR